MSFSADVKNELARFFVPETCCAEAELLALLRMGGTLHIAGQRNIGIVFTTENAAVARKVIQLIKTRFDLSTEVTVRRGRRLKKSNSYVVRTVPTPARQDLLEFLGIIGNSGILKADERLFRKTCCRRSYLRGAFLGGGSVNRPEREYHLEMVTANPDFAQSIIQMMKGFSLTARMSERKNDYLVYLKGGDSITAFLRVIEAHQALMDFENVRVIKDMRNQVNRLVNCETANLQKTVHAAVRQVEKIQKLAQSGKLEQLPAGLREAAEVRLDNPEATLHEMVVLFDGRLSKSGLNHRLRKLEKIADEFAQSANLQ